MPRPRAPSFDHTPLSLPPEHILVQLATAQGSGNYLSVDPDGEERLVEVSTKVKRAKVLIVKGDFAFVRLYPPGGRVVGEIVAVVDKNQVKAFKKAGEWPEGFGERPQPVTVPREESELEDTNEDPNAEKGDDHDHDHDALQ